MKTIKVYVELLDEGSPTIRGTEAVDLGNGLFRLLSTPNYDPEDETWAFSPGTIVRCERRLNFGENLLVAIEKVEEQET